MLTAATLLGIAVALAVAGCTPIGARLVRVLSRGLGAQAESELALLFVFIPARRLLLGSSMLAVAGMLAARLAGLPWPLVPVLGGLLLALPRLLLVRLRQLWRARLLRQLPDALAVWAGLLRAGQGTTQALLQVAGRQAAPLGDELRLVLGQLRLGVHLDAAFEGLRDRVGLADMRMLTAVLATHRELGGNLAESLQRLAELLRGRLQMESRIQSLTAQGRLQGAVVGLLPVLLLAVLYLMEPGTMRVLHTTWAGAAALVLLVILELTGYLMIRRIVRFDW